MSFRDYLAEHTKPASTLTPFIRVRRSYLGMLPKDERKQWSRDKCILDAADAGYVLTPETCGRLVLVGRAME